MLLKGWPLDSPRSRSLVLTLKNRTVYWCNQRKHGLPTEVLDEGTCRKMSTAWFQEQFPKNTACCYWHTKNPTFEGEITTYGITEDVNSSYNSHFSNRLLSVAILRTFSNTRPRGSQPAAFQSRPSLSW